MENLGICTINLKNLDVPKKPYSYVFADSGTIYATDGQCIYNVTEGSKVVVQLELPNEEIKNIFYVSIADQFILIDDKGDLWKIDLNGTAELMGSVSNGIMAAAVSPTEDRFVIVSATHDVIIFNQDLDVMSETELGISNGVELVSVGWGSEKTQFQGSQRNKSVDAAVIEENNDDGKTQVAWKGDGEYFVVSFNKGEGRQLQVFDKDCNIIHTSKPLAGVNSAVCWCPNGSTIGVSRRIRGANFVYFFEKNLLERGNFEVKCKDIKSLSWNLDSTYLAVTTESSILIYMQKNNHWYNKYTISIDYENVRLSSWDSNVTAMFQIITENGDTATLKSWRWNRVLNASSGASSDDQGFVAVIDGPKLCLTALGEAIIPPPMSTFDLSFTSNINSCGFLTLGAETENVSSNNLFVQTAKGCIELYRYDNKEKRYVKAACGSNFDFDLFQITWTFTDYLLASALDSFGNYLLAKLEIHDDKIKIITKPLVSPILAFSRLDSKVIACDQKNEQHKISIDKFEVSETHNLPNTGLIVKVEPRKVLFLLDNTHSLYAGDVLLAKNVTSFRTTENFILATTLQHKLLCWQLSNLEAKPSEREVERGSRLVTVVPRSSNVVLEMPRGNLEVVRPRALTIDALKHYLDVLDYASAFTEMRRDRINLNLLFDHNLSAFEGNVKTFVDSISAPSHLCTIIADLSSEDVTQTLYAEFYETKSTTKKNVEHLYSILLSEFESRSQDLFLPILSCLVRRGDFASALLKIQNLLSGNDPNKTTRAEKAMTHLLYFASAEELFKAALGIYDLDLATFVISKSQMDPKEYLPFISKLKNMDENCRKFEIDNHLNKFHSAVVYLSRCNDKVDACVAYVKRHDLHKNALKLFPENSAPWKSISIDYSAYLTRLNKNEEAGLVLRKACEWQLASHAFSRAGSWRLEIDCLKNIPGLSNEDYKKSLLAISENLISQSRYMDASKLFLEYLEDVKAGIQALCSAQRYDQAYHLAVHNNRKELIQDVIRPQALVAADNLTYVGKDAIKGLEQHLSRLIEVLDTESRKKLEDWDDSDSISTRSSVSSRRSQKSTRKVERNLLKKGAPFEIIGILAAMHDLVHKVIDVIPQVNEHNVMLLILNEADVAAQLQQQYKSVTERVKEIVKTAWPKNYNVPSISIDDAPVFINDLLPKVMFPPKVNSLNDWMLEIL